MSLQLRDIAFLSGISMAHTLQLIQFGLRTGAIRRKYKLDYPAMTGNENVERAIRAQQNTLEFFPLFSTSLWLSGIYFHQVPAGLAGLFYLYGRNKYFEGYLESADGRIPGFRIQGRALQAMILMFGLGFTNFLLEEYAGVSLKDEILKYIPFKL